MKEDEQVQGPQDRAAPTAPGGMSLGAELGREMKTLHRYVSSRVMGAMQEQLHDDDMSFRQMGAMHQLRDHAPLSVSRLAELTGLSLPAASHMTDRLVQRGYAGRHENPGDRRAKMLTLTPKGLDLVSVMDRRFTEAYQEVFQHVSPEAVQAAVISIRAIIGELQGNASDLSDCRAVQSNQPDQQAQPDQISQPDQITQKEPL